MSIHRAAAGEQCPQCGQGDLLPYGNGSKWACPKCYFLLPCCEGGELAAPSAAARECPPTPGTLRPSSR
jgi:hypothetical protein